MELKGVEVCRGSKARGDGRSDAPGSKVLKERRSPRRRGRTGTSVKDIERAVSSVSGSIASHCGATASGDGTATRCHSRIFPLSLIHI